MTTMSGHDRETNGRVKVHPAVLQILGLVIGLVVTTSAGAIVGYYQGRLQQERERSGIETRVTVAEVKADGTRERQEEILRRMDGLETKFDALQERITGLLPSRPTVPSFQRGQRFDK